MKQLKTLLFGLLLPCVFALCCFSTAKGDQVRLFRQTVQVVRVNDVNDASVRLNGKVTAGTLQTRGNPSMKSTGVVDSTVGDEGLIFGQNTFGTLNRGDKVDISFASAATNGATRITLGTWTRDGNVVDIMGIVGQPMPVAVNEETNEAFAIFFNPESVSITYSNIALFANNNLANFNLDQFFIPTGTLIAGPSTLTLAPGESITLSFGIVDPSLYQLALAQVALTSNPDDLFDVAGAAGPVPEPATLLLLGTGLAGVAAKLRRRARNKSSCQ